MSPLSTASLALGCVSIVAAILCLARPASVRACLKAFPRNRISAVVLTAVVIGWSSWLLYNTPLGRFDGLKRLIFVLAPLAVYLLARFVDELLAARSLGALLLLVPSPVLAAVRTSDSRWRWAVGIAAYCMVVAGIWLVLSPHRFRTAAGACAGTDGSCRVSGVVLGLCGVLFAVLAIAVF